MNYFLQLIDVLHLKIFFKDILRSETSLNLAYVLFQRHSSTVMRCSVSIFLSLGRYFQLEICWIDNDIKFQHHRVGNTYYFTIETYCKHHHFPGC